VLLVLALPGCKGRELERVDPAMPEEAAQPASAPGGTPSDAGPAQRSLEAVGVLATDAAAPFEPTVVADAGPPAIEVPDVIGEP